MNFWEILDLTPTSDENTIKKAYRAKLRQHHPEEDPEGFQRIRSAYEAAIHHAQSNNAQEHPFCSSQKETTSKQATEADHPLIQTLDSLFSDPARRFQYPHWQQWFQQVLPVSIKEQEAISDAALKMVMSNRWLPGEVIDWFWQGLGWSMLLRQQGQDAELGRFLDQWRQQQLLIPLSELSIKSGAEQRAILSYLRPLQSALENKWLDAVNYLFSQPMPWVMTSPVKLSLHILRFSLNCPAITQEIVQYYLIRLYECVDKLSADELLLVAQVCIRIKQPEKARHICQHLYTIGAHAEIVEIQYELTRQSQPELTVGFAFLRQQWTPLPAIYWRAERQLYQYVTNDSHPLYSWVYHHLVHQSDHRFNHPLDLQSQSGTLGTLLKCFWAGIHGSWAWITELHDNLHKEINTSPSDHQLLLQLTADWLNSLLSNRKESATLASKLDTYGKDAFFYQPDLTEEELTSLTSEEWRDYLCRHPLVPDNWFRQLTEKNYISRDILEQSPLYPYYVDTLCFYRCVNHHFKITSPWEDQSFAGSFDWGTVYYGQLVTSFIPDNSDLCQYLRPIPETLNHSALMKIVPFIENPDQYQSEAVEALCEHPEQFVFRYITNMQIRLLIDNYSIDTLFSLADNREPSAYAALSVKLMQEHFEEAIICWNLLVTAAKEKAQYNAFIDWQQQALIEIRTSGQYEQEYYEYSKPEIIYWMLLKETEHFTPPEEIATIIPEKDAKAYHYPMFYIITQLQHGISPDGYDIAPLKPLLRQQQNLSGYRQQVADLALGELEYLYQQHLDLDIENKNVKFFSKGRLKFYYLIMVMCWISNIFPIFATIPDEHTNAYGYSPILTSVFLFYQCLITWRVTQYLPARNHISYVLLVFVTLLVAGSGIKLFIILNLLIQFRAIHHLSPLRINGIWEKNLIRSKNIRIKELLR